MEQYRHGAKNLPSWLAMAAFEYRQAEIFKPRFPARCSLSSLASRRNSAWLSDTTPDVDVFRSGRRKWTPVCRGWATLSTTSRRVNRKRQGF